MDTLTKYQGNYMTRPIPEPIESYDDLLLTARELAEGVIDRLIERIYPLYLYMEDLEEDAEKAIKYEVAQYLEKKILERF